MERKVLEYIQKHKIFCPGEKVLVACSGGPDSLALLSILDLLSKRLSITLAAAHVNHMLRGQEADSDQDFVVEFCAKRSIPCYVGKLDVPKYKRETGKSLEDSAREVRYQFLYTALKKIGAQKIALGHHQDDQAETVLLHLLRGAGSMGLQGMSPLDGCLARPLLGLRRDEIRAYCQDQGLNPREDSSNQDTSILRNRIRLQLIPQLNQDYKSNMTQALCRTAEIVREEHAYIRNQADNWLGKIVTATAGKMDLELAKFLTLPLALQRELIRMVIEKKQGNRKGISFDHVETLLDMARSWQVGTSFILPGGLVCKKGYGILTVGADNKAENCSIAPPGYLLKVPGITWVKELKINIESKLLKQTDERPVGSAYLDWDTIELPLYVRTRQNGDRFSPCGLQGSKKLKSYFIDKKVPQEIRDTIPIVYDLQEIIWVGGYQICERCKVTQNTKHILQLSIKV